MQLKCSVMLGVDLGPVTVVRETTIGQKDKLDIVCGNCHYYDIQLGKPVFQHAWVK